MSDERVLAALDAISAEIYITPQIEQIRLEVTQDKRRGLSSTAQKSETWRKHREDAVLYCCNIIRQSQHIRPPISYAFSKEFSALTNDHADVVLNLDGLQTSLSEHWQMASCSDQISSQLFSRNDSITQEFRFFLTKGRQKNARRPLGRANSAALRNILIATMLETLKTLGWCIQKNSETVVTNSAIEIVYEAFCTVYSDAKSKQIKQSMITTVWKQYLSHKNAGKTYLGTTLENRKKGALHLITHAK